MAEYKLSKDFRDKIGAILGKHIFRVAKEDALSQAATEVLDARTERDRLQILLEAVRGEMRTLAAILIRRQAGERLVLTRKDFNEIPLDVEVHVETPEPGVRIYELRKKDPTASTKSRIQLQ